MKFFAPSLAGNFLGERIAHEFQEELTECSLTKFADGEISFESLETVRGQDCFIVHSICKTDEGDVNHHLMELMFMVDALRRASAKTINLVIPYLGYSRQDRRNGKRQPISSKVVASMLSSAGADRLLTMDLHCDQIEGFYDIPVDNLSFKNIIFEEIGNLKEASNEDLIIVAPDMGSAHRVHGLAKMLKLPMAIADKRRDKPNEVTEMTLVGSVLDKTAILIDDMIDTGGTIRKAGELLKEEGARKVIVYATHALFSGEAKYKIFEDDTPFDVVNLSNTSPTFPTLNVSFDKQFDEDCTINVTGKVVIKTKCQLRLHDVSGLFAEAIRNICDNRSVSESII